MNILDALKPNLWKTALTLILFSYYTFVTFACFLSAETFGPSAKGIYGPSGCTIGFPIQTFLPKFSSDFLPQLFSFITNFPHIFLANLVIFYFVSVLVIEGSIRLRPSERTKSQWREFLQPSNLKIAFTVTATVLGLISFLGQAGKLPSVAQNIFVIFLPLSLFSQLLFFAGAGISYLISLILLVFGNPFIGGAYPAYITPIGWIYFTIVLLVGWYLIASVIEQLYLQYVKKKRAE
jgi:hypothetical protein